MEKKKTKSNKKTKTQNKKTDKKNYIKKILYISLITILSCTFIFSTIQILINNQDSKNYLKQTNNNNPVPNENKSEYENALALFSENVDLEKMRTEYNNSDIVARLEIPELFNILITKTNDNDYYLTHSIYKKKDKKGTEYLDFRTEPNAKQVNVYGHNSSTYDIPFRKLEKFLDEEFFNSNQYILLQHDTDTRIYKIFSIKEVDNDHEHMIVDVKKENNEEHISNLINESIYTRYVDYDENSNLLILQTCSYDNKDSFYVISAIELNK